ncbi:hypothetical protein FQN50_008904 [Emmonsiellopsis sp. PD_5]|nr:hypothetical protein FQN50_008904 [Emmonsiellopsis sp. PD_5]
MPSSDPHPGTLFSLIPLNDRAKAVAAHEFNDDLARLSSGQIVLDIGFYIRSKSCNTLATLGRDGDVCIPDRRISKLHCSFEVDPETNVVMLYDRSHNQMTQVLGPSATPFQSGRPRKVVVQNNINTIFGMGGTYRNMFIFELEWLYSPAATILKLQNHEDIPLGYQNPRFARTIDDADTIAPTRRETRVHTAGEMQSNIRYAEIERLGSGSFGVVYKVVDVYTGRLMAVKLLHRTTSNLTGEHGRINAAHYDLLRQEVEILSEVHHPHIIDFIGHQGWGGPIVEIFMGLKEGTLQQLVESSSVFNVDSLFHQMLQALDYLAVKNIIHRDVKPENILYVTHSEQPSHNHQFQLGDFGLCNRTISAVSRVGTHLYRAPEISEGLEQTHKVDVWSLLVTIIWTLDTGRFRQLSRRFRSNAEIYTAISVIVANEQDIFTIREMGVFNSTYRASAAQMLVKCYQGNGLSTPWNNILPLQGTARFPETPVVDNAGTQSAGPTQIRYGGNPNVMPGTSPQGYTNSVSMRDA